MFLLWKDEYETRLPTLGCRLSLVSDDTDTEEWSESATTSSCSSSGGVGVRFRFARVGCGSQEDENSRSWPIDLSCVVSVWFGALAAA